jgi:hypothetical protein
MRNKLRNKQKKKMTSLRKKPQQMAVILEKKSIKDLDSKL